MHDHESGTTRVRDSENDLLELLLRRGDTGLTEVEAAVELYGVGDGDSQEDRNARKRANRKLKALVAGSCATYFAGGKGGAGGGGSPARWVAK
jgi:hypothetical protein